MACKTIQVASPNYKHSHGFVTESKATLRYMPLWDDDEIARCRDICYPDVDETVIAERAALVGNVPRFLFDLDNFERTKDHIGRMSPEMVNRIWWLVSNVKAPQARDYEHLDHKVAHIQPNEMFQKPILRFASKKVTEKVAELLARRNRDASGIA